MKQFLIIQIIAIAISFQAPTRDLLSESELSKVFSGYRAQYKKEYSTLLEYLQRREVFRVNQNIMVSNNNDSESTVKLGLTQFADLTNSEFRRVSHGQRFTPNKKTPVLPLSEVDLPDSVDWRSHSPSVLTAVKNQGQCGSCWAFSATETLESREALKTGKLVVLSEQQLVDCEHEGNPPDQGCGGGEMTNALNWFKEHGAMAEKDYPTNNSSGKCRDDESKDVFKNITGFSKVGENLTSLSQALVDGPVSIGVDAGGIAWQLYFGGIIKNQFLIGCSTGPLDHGVVAVGYDSEKWIVRNSWGSSWGAHGFVYLERKEGENTCGLWSDANVPNLS